MMKKVFNKKFLAFLPLAILIIVGIAFLTVGMLNKSKTYLADISLASGNVEKSEQGENWVKVKSGDDIKQGNIIKVSGEGKAIITLDDGSAIRLDSDSKVLLTSLDPKNIEISNQKGDVYTRVVKADRAFVVKVSDESYKSLGTAYMTVNSKNEQGVYVYESKVKAIAKNTEISQGKKFYKKYSSDSSIVNKVIDMSAADIADNEFVQWNKAQDLKNKEFKDKLGVLKTETPKPADPVTPTPAAPAYISLSASASSSGISLYWTASGIDTSNGFKLIKSTSPNPVYPGNYALLIGGGYSSYLWKITDGVTYNFRVCQFTGSGCGVYSNNVQATASTAPVTNTTGRAQVSWSVPSAGTIIMNSGVTPVEATTSSWPANGFKLVWSKTSGPTYPTRATDKYNYYSNPDTRVGVIDGFDGSGTYYVRVCEYQGGSCGVYSNQITANL